MNSTVLFKDLTPGSVIYALIKNPNNLHYTEGSIVSISQARVDMPDFKNNPMQAYQGFKNVVDVTYSLDGKNYTDVVEVTSCMFPTEKPGAISLITTDKDNIIRELQATLKRSTDYIKSTETEIPLNKKRIEDCEKLISSLDTSYAEKQILEMRIQKLENSSVETLDLLKQIAEKLKGL